MLVRVHEILVVSAKIIYPIKDFETGVHWLKELVYKLDMQVLAPATGAYCHEDGNRGLTILIPITTSHIAMHIWDEPNPARIELDVFSCKKFDPHIVFDHLNIMCPSEIKSKFLDRSQL